jgi:Holliday junction resolvase RusA-like endonuclease
MKFTSLNEVINESKKHWAKYSGFKKKHTDAVAFQAPRLQIDYRVDFHFEWHPKDKRKDHDNIAFNSKTLFDGMVDKGTIKTDRQEVVNSIFHTFVYDSKEEYVVVKILQAGA